MLRLDLCIRRTDFSVRADLCIQTPGVTALFGPSGAGKTTLVHAVTGLVAATGRLELDGAVLLDSSKGICLPTESRAIGCVFQDARLFPHLDVAGNLNYGFKRQRRAVYATHDEVVDLLGLAPLLQRKPHQLSGGERQRVGLGRALLSQPRLLVLDEPLASVDSARREEVLPYLEQLRDSFRIPMLYVSHQYDEVLRLASQVVLMDQGSVFGMATPAALSLSPTLHRFVGTAGVGTVIDTDVLMHDAVSGLITVSLAGHSLRLQSPRGPLANRLRLHILANEVILATSPPQGLSVRNSLPGTVERLDHEGSGLVLVTVRIGEERLLARVTPAAVSELAIAPKRPVWALIKAASLTLGTYPRQVDNR